jgi:hypothetical protein
VRKADNLNLYVPIVLKSGSLNLLEPSGPVQACNGIALPLPLPLPLYRRLCMPQGGSVRARNISPPLVFDHRNVRSLVSRYTDDAIPAHLSFIFLIFLICFFFRCLFNVCLS